jgi:LacI family transcriptional regulator
LSVPKDLSVVGFDDIALAAYASPPLTTVAQPKHRLGTLAATLLLERIAQRDLASRRRILQPALRLRQSTAAAPKARRGKGSLA